MPNTIGQPGQHISEVPSQRAITGVPTSVAAFVGRAPRGPVNRPEQVTSMAQFEDLFGPPWAESGLGYAVRSFFANGGGSAVVVRVDDGSTAAEVEIDDGAAATPSQGRAAPGATAYLGGAGAGQAIRALDAVDVINLLVLPPITPQGQLPDEVWSAALDYARERRAFLIVDPPPGLAGPDISAWLSAVGLTGTAASHAALYYPRLEQVDPQDGPARQFAASGAVAGVYARTDATRGVWKSPAGDRAEILDAAGLSETLTDAASGQLNRQGINVIRSFPGRGIMVWGGRTLAGADSAADDYKYVPVRRLALHIEESLHRGTQWAVFEPNAEPLWAQLRLQISAFLQDLFRQGAFAGSTSRDAYFVKCDAGTTSQSDILAGVVNVVVGFAPLKPAEFVVLHLRWSLIRREE